MCVGLAFMAYGWLLTHPQTALVPVPGTQHLRQAPDPWTRLHLGVCCLWPSPLRAAGQPTFECSHLWGCVPRGPALPPSTGRAYGKGPVWAFVPEKPPEHIQDTNSTRGPLAGPLARRWWAGACQGGCGSETQGHYTSKSNAVTTVTTLSNIDSSDERTFLDPNSDCGKHTDIQ